MLSESTMEQVYALGIDCIQFVQYWFEDWAWCLEKVNDFSNPQFLLEVLFPLVSVVDSVFAAQLLLVLGFGGRLNSAMKWWFFEDRPYWWVQETSFYHHSRPRLLQTRQTCVAGPGSPSGHCTASAAVLLLFGKWAAHVMRDSKCYIHCWKYVLYPLGVALLTLVMLARLYVASHFPHQCLLGALIGAFIAPALCIYVSDPAVWRYGALAGRDARVTVAWHGGSVLIIALISALSYGSLKLCGLDPPSTVKQAYRWCERPENVQLSTTPMFALALSIAALLGWAVSVTPEIAKYRHDTQQRSLVISSLATGAVVCACERASAQLASYFAAHVALAALKPVLLLRLTPALAMWPYGSKDKVESLIKESSHQPSEGHYSWLKSRQHHDYSKDLETFKPMVVKMTSESCALIAVKLDNLTDENVTTTVILDNFKRLLLEQHSIQLIEDNVKIAKETKHVRKRNRVAPELGAGRQPVVSFILD